MVDNSYFDDQLLPPAFDQQPNETAAFRAPISAAPVERNAYVINVLPAAAAGEPARVRLAAAGHFVVDSQVTTANSRRDFTSVTLTPCAYDARARAASASTRERSR